MYSQSSDLLIVWGVKMRTVIGGRHVLAAGFLSLVIIAPGSAMARCKTFSAYYNGTDIGMGAANAAEERMRGNVASWAKQNKIRRYRIGRVKKACGEWYFTPFLPHHKCTAKARVCY